MAAGLSNMVWTSHLYPICSDLGCDRRIQGRKTAAEPVDPVLVRAVYDLYRFCPGDSRQAFSPADSFAGLFSIARIFHLFCSCEILSAN